MGLMAHRAGTVRFNGRDISRLKPFEIARLGLGYTPEDRRIFSELTVLVSTSAASRRVPSRTAALPRHGRPSGCSRSFPTSPRWAIVSARA